MTPRPSPRGAAIWTAVASVVFVGALFYRREEVPPGLCNDAAEEALRGILLIEQGRIEAITTVLGNSAETLYLYMVGGAVEMLGSTTLAVQIPSIAVGLGTLLALFRVLPRFGPRLPSAVPVLAAASSVWLFHYSRSGLRTIAAPLFTALLLLALDGMERGPDSRKWPAFAGLVAGLGTYAYTSCRLLPLVLAVYLGVRWLRTPREDRGRLRRGYATALLALGAISLPNLWLLAHAPRELLLRGAYVLPQTGRAVNFLASLVLPVHYGDSYRALSGPSFFFDGVSGGLAASGIAPVHPFLSAALVWGAWACWRRRDEPRILALALLAIGGTAAFGVAGPSLTRFLALLPVYLAIAVAGLDDLAARWRTAGTLAALALVGVAASDGVRYFREIPVTPGIDSYYAPRATALGARARELAADGTRVRCLLTEHANVVRYLSHDHASLVSVVEFHDRAFDAGEAFGSAPAQVLLLEAAPGWERVLSLLPPGWRVAERRDGWVELRLGSG